MRGTRCKEARPVLSGRMWLARLAILLFGLSFFLPAPAGSATVTIKYLNMTPPYVCPCEEAKLSWGMDVSDLSMNLTALFDLDGDGKPDRVLDHCPLTGELSFTPPRTGSIKPVMRVKANGVVLARRAASATVHTPLSVPYSRGREVIRFGRHAPCTFYATDVALDRDGKFYVTDWLRNMVLRHPRDGMPDLTIWPTVDAKLRRLTVGSDGRIYVTDTVRNSVRVFDRSGMEIAVWNITARFGHHVGPGGIKFIRPNQLLLTTADSVLLLNGSGHLLFEFGSAGTGPGQFSRAYDAAVALDGGFFVVDGAANRLLKFDSLGGFSWSIGGKGTGPGQFHLPVAVVVDAAGNVYVSDRLNYRIQKFDSNGQFLLQWGSEGHEASQFFWHNGIATDPLSGNIWVAGYHNHDVQAFDPGGHLVDRWIGYITGPGEFGKAAGIAASVDKVFVVDTIHQQVKVFDKATGLPLYQFGERGGGDGTVFNFPRAMALSSSGHLFITEDRYIREIRQDGTFLRAFQSLTGNLSASLGICVYGNRMYQADTDNHKLNARHNKTGEAIWIVGGEGSGPGQFERPSGVTIGAGPTVLVTDLTKRVQTLDLSGSFIRQWSTVGANGSKMVDSQGIAYDASRQIVYVGRYGAIDAYDMCGAFLFSWAPTNPPEWPPIFRHLTVDEGGTVYATDHLGTVYGFVPE